MFAINWVNPDTLRTTQENTGTLRIEAPGIEIQIELFAQLESENWRDHIDRSLQLLNSIPRDRPTLTLPEPDPEPALILDIPQPEFESEPIPFEEFQ